MFRFSKFLRHMQSPASILGRRENMNLRTRTAPIVFAAILGALPSVGKATDYTWIAGSGNWNDPTRWVGGNIPQDLPSDQIFFPGSTYSTTVTTDNNPWIVNGITFSDTGTVTIKNTNSSGIQFDGPLPFITLEPLDNASNAMINGPVIFAQTV